MDVLVSGAASGLGKFLCRELGGTPFTRQTRLADVATARAGRPFSAIVHCAATARRGVTDKTLGAYLDDNLLLTERLLALPHARFVFVSSVAVYGGAEGPVRAQDEIEVDDSGDLYAFSKLAGEALVLRVGVRPLVIRASALLGLDARPNSLSRILTEAGLALTLAAESTFNYVLHEDVLQFIRTAMDQDAEGVFNVAASERTTLGAAAAAHGRSVTFGAFRYRTPLLDTAPARALAPNLELTSMQNIARYAALLGLS